MPGDTDVNVSITTTNTAAQTGQTGQAGGTEGNPVETLTVLMQLLMQGKTADKTDGTTSADSTNEAQESLQLTLQNGTDKTKIDITIDNPTLPFPSDQLTSLAIDMIASGGGLGDDHPLTVLIKSVQDQITVNANEGGGESDSLVGASGESRKTTAGGGGPVPPLHACAFLGGLVMVALAEVLANYAKQQSSMEKEMATLWAKTESMLKDLAKCMAQNILNKGNTQAESNILQGVMSGIGAGISIMGAAKSFNVLKAGAKEKEGSFAQQRTTQEAQNWGTIASSGSQIFTGVGTNLIKSWEDLKVADYDAKEKIMENVQQQLSAMVDKYNTGEQDAKKAVGDALDLLKNLMDALAQAFKGLGGGH